MIWCTQHRQPLNDFDTCNLVELDGKPCNLVDRLLVEAGALIITPDENGIWPNQARRVVADFLMLAATVRRASLVAATEVLDALRDAMPDGDS